MNETLPGGFAEMLEGLGHEAYLKLPAVIAAGEPVVAVRVNRAKGAAAPAEGEAVAWCADGYYLPGRRRFTFDPALHQGLYYVQDASSMAIAAAVGAIARRPEDRPLRYLDACAAPGGKTTAAMSALPPDSFVVANEYDPRRASVLAENVAKWGRAAVVTRGDASALAGLDGFFDIMAADVPCSGEGMMRKDPQAVAQWSPELVARCAALQRDITDALWRALRPGGYMIYSTCTFNLDENERMVARLMELYGAEPVAVEALERPEILGAMGGYDFPAYRFVPGAVRGEGLFMAVLHKPGDGGGDAAQGRRRRDKGAGKNRRGGAAKPLAAVPQALEGDYIVTEHADGRLYALPAVHAADAAAVAAAMYVTAPGIEAGEIKGHDFIPAQPLALACDYRRGTWPEAEVDADTALAYLRREAVTAPDGAPRGIVLLTFGGHPLGFVKNLGNRANNLYPAPWRILSK